MKAQVISYQSILRQRAMVAALTLGLIAVLIWTIGEIVLTERKSPSIPAARLIEPLNPELDLSLVQQLEALPLVTAETAKQLLPSTGANISFPAASGSASPVVTIEPSLLPSPAATSSAL